VALQLDGQDALWQGDHMHQHFDLLAQRIQEGRLRFGMFMDGNFAGGVTKWTERLNHRKAFWAIVAAFRYVTRMMSLAMQRVKRPALLVAVPPDFFRRVHGSDRLNICSALFASRTALALSGSKLFFKGHRQEKSKFAFEIIFRRICSQYCSRIEVMLSCSAWMLRNVACH
jgi:hypothetical protein